MGRVSHSTRRIPVALPASEVILTVGRSPKRGGDGWAALKGRATGGSATTLTWTRATGTDYNDFEAAAETTADRFNGLRIKSVGRVAIITDYSEAAGVGTFTFASGELGGAPAAGQVFWVEADIPLWVSYLMIHAVGDELRFNVADQAGLIAAGQYSVIGSGLSNLIVDDEFGTPGYRIRLASGGAGATTAGLDIAVP